MIETTSAPPGSSTVTSVFTAPGAMFLTRPFKVLRALICMGSLHSDYRAGPMDRQGRPWSALVIGLERSEQRAVFGLVRETLPLRHAIPRTALLFSLLGRRSHALCMATTGRLLRTTVGHSLAGFSRNSLIHSA